MVTLAGKINGAETRHGDWFGHSWREDASRTRSGGVQLWRCSWNRRAASWSRFEARGRRARRKIIPPGLGRTNEVATTTLLERQWAQSIPDCLPMTRPCRGGSGAPVACGEG